MIIAGYNLRLMIIFQGMSQLSAPNLYGPYGAETRYSGVLPGRWFHGRHYRRIHAKLPAS